MQTTVPTPYYNLICKIMFTSQSILAQMTSMESCTNLVALDNIFGKQGFIQENSTDAMQEIITNTHMLAIRVV